MASSIPSQERMVDPFASYNSNVVNKLTEVVTQSSKGLLTINSLQVTQDLVSPNDTIIVGTGYAVKDDVLIKITSEHTVDFTDDEQWVTPPDILFPGGNCYVVLEYQYLKQRPAPQANIKILQPGERSLINGDSVYLLLKVVKTSVTSPHNITALYDYDPEVGYEDNARPYIKYYASGEVNLPVHNQTTDQGRVVYESERNKFFFGYNDQWGELTSGGVSFDIDTTSGVSVGEICYVDSNGDAQLSVSTALNTQADFIVTAIGTVADGIGRGIICGYWDGVPVEAGISIVIGDILYLSAITAGAVTNVKPSSSYQVVGRSLSAGNVTTPIEMIFSPKLMLTASLTGQISVWSGSYYADVDVTIFNKTNAFDCHWFDDSTDKEVMPEDVEIRDSGNTIRVSFPVSGLTINYMIS